MWNQKYPHCAYYDYRALSKAYREAYREVVYPHYQMGQPQKPENKWSEPAG
jgi:hypothetical protein